MNIIIGISCLVIGTLSFFVSFHFAEKINNTNLIKIIQYLGIILYFIGIAMFWLIA
ncbi:hypothetical protein [Listeria immobilis]|uniref:hypothetical protein n=1 Tax=Listeria immobilis TaxID=2713502 RepID=UPI0016283DE1|nr:hypothetical protein [Listeria immobilis]MBC1515952.1 hypothetical protein [Listeria immobilis]